MAVTCDVSLSADSELIEGYLSDKSGIRLRKHCQLVCWFMQMSKLKERPSSGCVGLDEVEGTSAMYKRFKILIFVFIYWEIRWKTVLPGACTVRIYTTCIFIHQLIRYYDYLPLG